MALAGRVHLVLVLLPLMESPSCPLCEMATSIATSERGLLAARCGPPAPDFLRQDDLYQTLDDLNLWKETTHSCEILALVCC